MTHPSSSPTVSLIHTSASMIPLFKSLAAELLPAGLNLFNMVDESLLCDIIREKGCPPDTARRLVGHVLSATSAGADIVMVTCSSMGRSVELAAQLTHCPVLRVDLPMVEEAIAAGTRIGVIATLPSTLEPTVELVRRRAQHAGKTVQVLQRVVEGAFHAVISGDGTRHDALVSSALAEMGENVDVIVLAQASMARVVEQLQPEQRRVPILSSPRSGMRRLAELVAAARAPARNVQTQCSNA